MQHLLKALTAFAILLVGVACTSHRSDDPSINGAQPASDPLANSSWRLVTIQFMNDTSSTPEQRGHYTLTFGDHGNVQIRADCNRGSGSYSYVSPSGLEFGAMATTKALCPPDSLHDTYLSNLSKVRSFVFRDDHLFLATMADGAIMEFEPL